MGGCGVDPNGAIAIGSNLPLGYIARGAVAWEIIIRKHTASIAITPSAALRTVLSVRLL